MDLCFHTPKGIFHYRVGAIIIKDQTLLMIRNQTQPYYYSVGGRVRFGETAEQALQREISEELGLSVVPERLVCIYENFFHENGNDYHEIALHYSVTLEDADQVKMQRYQTGKEEQAVWIPLASLNTIELYPAFYKTDLKDGLPRGIIHRIENNLQ